MYAIVEIAGQQFKVEKEQEIFVHRLQGEPGSSVNFDHVLLYDNDGKISVGTPGLEGMTVKAKILEHLKGDKVIVFHKKRRKGYQKQNGHRQYLSKILIEDIMTVTPKKAKKEVEKEAEKPEAKKTRVKEVKAKPKEKKEVKTVAKPKEKKEVKTVAKPKPKTKAKEEKPREKEAPKKEVKAKVQKPKTAKPKKKTEE
jgi:large subunit ribosomal protein L21